MRRWTRNGYVHCWTRLPEVPLHFQRIIRHTLVVAIKKTRTGEGAGFFA